MTIDVVEFVLDQAAGWEHVEQVHDAIVGVATALKDAMEIDYVGTLYRTSFSVSGFGAFPVDMLRYERAWPATESDVAAIETSLELADADDPFTVRLTKYHRDPAPRLAEERWVSKFRWKVVGVVETIEM